MIPTDSIVLKLPYPVKFLTIGRKIGFLFTNLSIFLFREANGLKDSKDYTDWVNVHGESGLIAEMLYHSACAWSLQNRKKQNFTKSGLSKAIALLSAEKQGQLMNVWKQSEIFGATIKQSKKKPITK